MTNIEKCEIYVTVRNGQKMKYELKCTLNMKLHGGETVKFPKVLYIPQAVKNILSVSMIAYKGDTMGATQEKMTIRKN